MRTRDKLACLVLIALWRFLKSNEWDSGSCLMVGDIDSCLRGFSSKHKIEEGWSLDEKKVGEKS